MAANAGPAMASAAVPAMQHLSSVLTMSVHRVRCRYDPSSAHVQADALELSAALNPDAATTPESLKERADARFKAGDLEGAAEAYTALMQRVKQQQADLTAAMQQEQQQEPPPRVDTETGEEQQQQQQECVAQLLAALSNRAACWLSLEQYSTCIEDCQVALALALAGQPGTHRAAAAATTCTSTDPPAAAAAVVSRPDTNASAASDAGAESGVAVQSLLHLLQQQQPEQMLAAPAAGAARVRSVARLVSRLAVAHGCLKETQHAVQLYGLAQCWWLAVGDEQRAVEMAADQQRLQQLLSATQAA
jgi:hypothetical protein